MIRRSGSPGHYKYTVVAHSGRKMGTYTSRAGAVKRLRQIEWFKNHPVAKT